MQRSWRNSRTCKDLLKTASDSDTDTDTELQNEQLPTYHPLSYVAKKHNSQLKSAENAIHIIPFLLLLCALVLCFFSIPEKEIMRVRSVRTRSLFYDRFMAERN